MSKAPLELGPSLRSPNRISSGLPARPRDFSFYLDLMGVRMRLRLAPRGFREAALSVVVGATAAVGGLSGRWNPRLPSGVAPRRGTCAGVAPPSPFVREQLDHPALGCAFLLVDGGHGWGSWHPSGMRMRLGRGSGGVARSSLHHRLMAENPPGSMGKRGLEKQEKS